jgi:hypothetical protein
MPPNYQQALPIKLKMILLGAIRADLQPSRLSKDVLHQLKGNPLFAVCCYYFASFFAHIVCVVMEILILKRTLQIASHRLGDKWAIRREISESSMSKSFTK